jgi:hypothetical protein
MQTSSLSEILLLSTVLIAYPGHEVDMVTVELRSLTDATQQIS